MFTRKDYLDHRCTHREYFAQFVDDRIKAAVVDAIGLDRLLASTDKYLNDIPLREWDVLAGAKYRNEYQRGPMFYPRSSGRVSAALLRESGEGLSLASLVCIYKEAAHQIIDARKEGA